MLHPAWILLASLVVLAVALRLRFTLPVGLILAAIVASLLAGFGVPFRHLVEGGFGYLNLVLALFAGAFFGQAMLASGSAEAVAERIARLVGGRVLPILFIAGAMLFVAGMFVGIAGVAVLAMGVFVAPLLRRIGLDGSRIAVFIAVVATAGMIAPPLNTPAMTIADGVNMPYAAFAIPLLVLSVPPALLAVLLAARRASRAPGDTSLHRGAVTGFICLGLVLGFWTLLRLFPAQIPDPAVPLVLVIGALVALPGLGRTGLAAAFRGTFSGTPLMLAAVLITVGVAVQIMTLTGIRGFLVINTMAFPEQLTYAALLLMPIIGGVLTSIGTSNVLGVPFAFAFIHQDMILNVSAISAVAALSEFVPPTAIAAALATFVVGDAKLGRVIRLSFLPAAFIFVLAVAMLIAGDSLTALLQTGGTSPSSH